MNEPKKDLFKVDVLFGQTVMDSRFRNDVDCMIGEGRSWHYDRYGNLTKDTGWQPTGVVVWWPKPEPKRWWELWK